MFKKIVAGLTIGIMLLLFPACEKPDPKDVCKVITQASGVAYNEVIRKNPDLEKPLGDLAYGAVEILGSQEVDVIKAKELLYSTLSQFSSLDEDEKRIIVDMFAIVIPMLELPREGTLGEKATYFTICFFEGVINAVEAKEQLKTDEEVETKLAQLLEGL